MTGISRLRGTTHASSEACTVTEFGVVGDSDLAEAHINGRYPESGYALNRQSDMIIRVISGMGALATNNVGYELHAGSVVKIEKETPYFYDGNHLRLMMICSPPWSPEQYEEIAGETVTS